MTTKILNLGCGNDFYGTDRIDICKTPATTKVWDIDNKKLPYPNEYFDEIFCKSVIEHMRNLGNFIKECYRVLKKGGKLYVRTDYSGYLPVHIGYRYEHNRSLYYAHQSSEDHHYHHFTESHLRYLFKSFKIKNIKLIYGGGNPIKNFICRILPKRLGVVHLDLYASKSIKEGKSK